MLARLEISAAQTNSIQSEQSKGESGKATQMENSWDTLRHPEQTPSEIEPRSLFSRQRSAAGIARI